MGYFCLPPVSAYSVAMHLVCKLKCKTDVTYTFEYPATATLISTSCEAGYIAFAVSPVLFLHHTRDQKFATHSVSNCVSCQEVLVQWSADGCGEPFYLVKALLYKLSLIFFVPADFYMISNFNFRLGKQNVRLAHI